MTNFDRLLMAAFLAGRKRGDAECMMDMGYRQREMPPSFDEWRATVGQ